MMEFHILSQGDRQPRAAEEQEAQLLFGDKPSCGGPGPGKEALGWVTRAESS